MKTTLRFDCQGLVGCLYTELVDLRELGRLQVVRATEITFEPEDQTWEVRAASTGGLLFSHNSRGECLRWEQEHLQPRADEATATPTIHP